MGRPGRRIIPLFIPHEGCPHACSFCDQRAISGEERMTPEKAAKVVSEHLVNGNVVTEYTIGAVAK